MRLKNYLVEDSQKNQEIWEEMSETLKLDCSEIISIYKKAKGFLYRGNKRSIDTYDYFTPREDRRPKDTPKIYHDMMDDIFKKKYGWRARSEGVFVSGKEMAKGYGRVYLFFPVNGYKYLWSETIHDLYSSVEDFNLFNQDHWEQWQEEYGYETGRGYWLGENSMIYDNIEDIKKELFNFSASKSFVEFGKNILSIRLENGAWLDFVWTPEVSYETWLTENEEELFYQYLKDKLDLNPYEHTNLEQCIKKNQIEYNQREAMFKCKGYYLVNFMYEDEMKKYFGIY